MGDVYCILAALASAMFIVRLSSAAQKYSAALLNVCSLWTVTLFSLVWFGVEHISDLSFIREQQWKLAIGFKPLRKGMLLQKKPQWSML
ncbi:uncharacterized protein Gasu_17070 [Galdieria sulphuraria]|uniref:Uncharacterized protein n=1 Tax=Galdieria sulphuraria TaxID=130081 RepID=M2X3G6_GALSU|nr:uncharacterized protein Gasu_17070 [Galdieria sulphuraria]EME30940.1 hypothetical protein Gasu_17070 [Galdieria sulphuraria]|eukprot:XP_005707460.1 hypothetical protein Gasu_17070 [Galdieria sulphuraria]